MNHGQGLAAILKRLILAALLLSLFTGMVAYADVVSGEYDVEKLKNWTDEAFQEEYGMSAAQFRPSDPQPLYYIVTCDPVIDPRTRRESEGGWSYQHRTEPASVEDVLESTADLSSFGLTLTDDPNRASFQAQISYQYVRNGSFNYRQEGAKIPMYKGVLTIRLINMLTMKSAAAKQDCWCFPEDSIQRNVLDEGIGGQFFAGPVALQNSDVSSFSDLLGIGVEALYRYHDDEGGGICIDGYIGDSDLHTLELPSMIQGKPVTSIGKEAFKNSYFTSVILPETLIHIDEAAFQVCFYLTSITIPPSVTVIGEKAFDNTGLRKLVLPDHVTEIGYSAFSACVDLKSIQLPSGLKKIPQYAFSGSAITSIVIPDTVTEIGEGAFSGCESLRKVNLPASVRRIGESAFSSCIKLTEVSCTGEIDAVGISAFSQCEKLSTVRFQGGVKTIGDQAFFECSRLKTIDLTGAESLGSDAFREASLLKSVILPETLAVIGENPFGEHVKDRSYSIPKALKLTVVEGSYAKTWANEEGIPCVYAAPTGK